MILIVVSTRPVYSWRVIESITTMSLTQLTVANESSVREILDRLRHHENPLNW